MKNYIKPEVKVYKVRIESLLSGSGVPGEDGQLGEGDAKVHDYFLFNEENGGLQPKDVSLWDDEDCDE